jgi:hybrid cluster-associated redox disulfide protein
MATKAEVTKDSVIGDVIKTIPGAEKVIEKYFGTGCFTCPGINMETIAFGATMHNVDPNKVVEDIKKLEETNNAE